MKVKSFIWQLEEGYVGWHVEKKVGQGFILNPSPFLPYEAEMTPVLIQLFWNLPGWREDVCFNVLLVKLKNFDGSACFNLNYGITQ